MELDNDQVLTLLERVADRDEKAFARLYESVSRRVYAFAMHKLGDATAASEIVSETLYQVWRTPSAFRGDAKFSTWLLGIARHKLIDRHRGRAPAHEDIEPCRPPGRRHPRRVCRALRAATTRGRGRLPGKTHRPAPRVPLPRVLRRPGAGVRIVFYAGHGAQVRGHNHLIPVDAPMSSADELTARSLTADGRRLKVRGAAKGLAAPGVPLEQMFKRVRVMRESAQRQRPWEESSLTVDYCLAGC